MVYLNAKNSNFDLLLFGSQILVIFSPKIKTAGFREFPQDAKTKHFMSCQFDMTSQKVAREYLRESAIRQAWFIKDKFSLLQSVSEWSCFYDLQGANSQTSTGREIAPDCHSDYVNRSQIHSALSISMAHLVGGILNL